MLSPTEQAAVQAGWAKVSQNKISLGQQIFLTMFNLFPKHQQLFSDFKGRTRAELEVSPKLKAHGVRVVNALDGAIQNLDDIDVCTEVLELIGNSHQRHRVAPQHFDDLHKVMKTLLHEKLGSEFTDNAEAWTKLLNFVIPAIQRGLKK